VRDMQPRREGSTVGGIECTPGFGEDDGEAERTGASPIVIGLLAELDRTLAELMNEFPGWRIWYVYHPDAITWCAQRMPVLNTRSAEDLGAAIRKAMARNDTGGLDSPT
jgi:hypothetical protein